MTTCFILKNEIKKCYFFITQKEFIRFNSRIIMAQKKSGIVFNPKKKYGLEKPSNIIDSEEDFPELDFLKTKSELTKTSLDFKQISEETTNSENGSSSEDFRPGWTYGTVNSKTNTPQWNDLSKSQNQTISFPFQNTDYLDQLITEHEIEKQNFIEEYGYDEAKRYYGFTDNESSDQEEISDMENDNDDYTEYSDEEY